MAGRQGRNKGSKGKPGFQPIVGKGIKPPTTMLEMKTTHKNPTSTTVENSNIIDSQLDVLNTQLYSQYKNNKISRDEYIKAYNATLILSRRNRTVPDDSSTDLVTYLQNIEDTMLTEYKNSKISRDEYCKIYDATLIISRMIR